MATHTIEIDETTAAALERRAKARGQSVAEVLADLVASDDGPIDTSTAQVAELERRWDQFIKQPTSVPHDKVVRWLETWGTTDDRPRLGR